MGFETQDLDDEIASDINQTFNTCKNTLFSYYKIFLNNKTQDYSAYIISIQVFLL